MKKEEEKPSTPDNAKHKSRQVKKKNGDTSEKRDKNVKPNSFMPHQ